MKRGFTLIEALASTALAALLMLAGVSVVASLGRSRAILTRDAARTEIREVVEMIRFDLANARWIKARANHVTLTGFGGLDPRTLAPNHRPVRIIYTLKKTGSQTWLVREQAGLDAPSSGNGWSELICAGVEKFSIESIEGSGEAHAHLELARDGPDGGTSDEEAEGLPAQRRANVRAGIPLPGHVRLVIVPAVPSGPSVSQRIVIR